MGLQLSPSARVREYDATAPRDPDTEILHGAEPRTLGPEDGRRAVLFVHGFSGSPNNFCDLPDQVARAGWHVQAMLLPGHGRYVREFEKTSAEELLAGVIEEVRKLRERFGTVVLVGHSLGGALCTLTAAQMQVDALVLASPFFAVRHRWFYLMRPERWAKVLQPAVRHIYAPPGQEPVRRREARKKIVSYRWIPTKSFLTAMEVSRRAGDAKTLRHVTCPVLLIHSTEDRITSPPASGRAVDAMPSRDKRFVWLEESDHIIFWDYDRARVAREVLDFLSRVPQVSHHREGISPSEDCSGSSADTGANTPLAPTSRGKIPGFLDTQTAAESNTEITGKTSKRSSFEVREISSEATRPLRHNVLRPGRPYETTVWPGDEDPSTWHGGAFAGEELAGIVTLLHAATGSDAGKDAWQLRGMAVLHEWQGKGCGTALVEACLAHVNRKHGTLLWCNARAHARGFYERCGFTVSGDQFEVPEIGPHYPMQIALNPRERKPEEAQGPNPKL